MVVAAQLADRHARHSLASARRASVRVDSGAIYGLGLTGIPVVNVNNNCSTGSSALFLARQALEGGIVDCALAVGFEKMERGSLGMITYEALGLAEQGHGHELVDARATTFGGSGPVVNPSGGLISKGHPLGATGLAQCSELTWPLRGHADARQVDGATAALQHNIGLGGAAVVTVYTRPQQ